MDVARLGWPSVELIHCALDIAEQLTSKLSLGTKDPLYYLFLAQLMLTNRS